MIKVNLKLKKTRGMWEAEHSYFPNYTRIQLVHIYF